MIALALLAQVTAAVPLSPPSDLASLPPLPLTQRLPGAEPLSTFVKAEVDAGRCPAPPRGGDGVSSLAVDMALLVDRAGTVRRIVPRAIGCPTVEQYAAGVVASVARGNVTPPAADGWYRLTMSFAWR
jgi:hypothetical protein